MQIHQSRLRNVPVRPEGPPLRLHAGEGFLVNLPLVYVVNNTTVDCINPVQGAWLQKPTNGTNETGSKFKANSKIQMKGPGHTCSSSTEK